MIVNYTEQGWEIFSQRSHGILAAAIASEWSHKVRTKRWVETLLAIAEHDDGQVELESPDLLTAQGGPLDFSMRKMEYEHCECSMTRAFNKSTYIALLCSTHLDFLCKGGNAADKAVVDFMSVQHQQRREWMKLLHMSAQELERDYRLLEWCDALSLLLCQNALQPEGRGMEVSTGPDGVLHQLLNKDGKLSVDPWPFELDELEFSCEYRVIDQLTFKNAAEFKKCYQDTPVSFKTWYFRK